MTEQTNAEGGAIHIAPEVIEVISGLATLEIDGVAGMIGGFASGVSELLGRKYASKGVKVQLQGQEAKVDVTIAVHYGRAIPVVAQAIQHRVQQTIETMTGLAVREVNVHVVDVQFPQPEGQQEATRPDLL